MYRARTLLIPADLLRDDAVVAAINTALAPVGMGIVLPDLDSRPVRSEGPAAEALRRLPRIVGLVPTAPPPAAGGAGGSRRLDGLARCCRAAGGAGKARVRSISGF